MMEETKDDTECTLLRMLLGDYSNDEELKAEADDLWEWVDKAFNDLIEIHPMKNSFQFTNSSRAAKPQLLALLTDFLQRHEWANAGRILMRLTSEPNTTSHIAHRVGMELVLQDGSEVAGLMERLMKQLKVLLDLNTRVLGLDYFLVLLKEGLLKEARDILRNFHLRQHVGRRALLRKTPQDEFVTESLYRGYEGLTYYTEWWKMLEDASEAENSVYETSLVPQDHAGDLKHLAEKAIECFAGLEKVSNVLDIFVQPYVHLLQYLGLPDSALDVLQAHCHNSPDNANAWRLLLQHYTDHIHKHKDLMVEPLKQLCRLLPSETKWVLQYRRTANTECLEILFQCLDFPENQVNSSLWEALAEDLLTSDVTREVHDFWGERCDWWTELYFSEGQVVEDTGQSNTEALEECVRDCQLTVHASELISCKASVACLLCGPDNGYTTQVVLIGRMLDDESQGRGWCLLHKTLSCNSYDDLRCSD